MMDWNASLSILSYQGILAYIGKGVAFTLVISVLSVAISIALGSGLPLPQILRQKNVGADQRGDEDPVPWGSGPGAV